MKTFNEFSNEHVVSRPAIICTNEGKVQLGNGARIITGVGNTITDDIEIILDGQRYMFEKGDKVKVLEATQKIKVGVVTDKASSMEVYIVDMPVEFDRKGWYKIAKEIIKQKSKTHLPIIKDYINGDVNMAFIKSHDETMICMYPASRALANKISKEVNVIIDHVEKNDVYMPAPWQEWWEQYIEKNKKSSHWRNQGGRSGS